jgi:phospholipid/cholesterol/gamma-HCH transport system permease protein
VTVDLGQVERLDTTGAWLVHRTLETLRGSGAEVSLRAVNAQHAAMLDRIAENYRPCAVAPPQPGPIARLLEHTGEATFQVIDWAARFVEFLGRANLAMARTLLRPARLRFTSTVSHIEEVGLNALPIVGLLAFLIGIVLAYQGALQLEQFGAQLFVVDLLAVSILREIGILLTAVVVAGRSGSAFTAQIGAMQVHDEIDALQTLGLDPMEILVLPRVLALVIALPLLAFFADIMGLVGGGLMCWVVLDIAPELYVERLRDAVSVGSFWVGIVKAPVFAVLIALVGCHEGLRVSRSAESVGRHTTRAVVEAIFLVIVANALFSILFGIAGL